MDTFSLLPEDTQLKMVTGKINTLLRETGRADLVGQFEFKWVVFSNAGKSEKGMAFRPLTPAAKQYLDENTIVSD